MSHPDDSQLTTVAPLALPEIVTLPTEIDITNSETVGHELLAAFRPGVWVVIADMTTTVFCDSTGIRQLILANNHAVCTAAELRVVAGTTAVLKILHVIGADQMLRLYPDMQTALTGAPEAPEQQAV